MGWSEWDLSSGKMSNTLTPYLHGLNLYQTHFQHYDTVRTEKSILSKVMHTGVTVRALWYRQQKCNSHKSTEANSAGTKRYMHEQYPKVTTTSGLMTDGVTAIRRKQEMQPVSADPRETSHTAGESTHSLTQTHAGGHLCEEFWGWLQDSQSGGHAGRHTDHSQCIAWKS